MGKHHNALMAGFFLAFVALAGCDSGVATTRELSACSLLTPSVATTAMRSSVTAQPRTKNTCAYLAPPPYISHIPKAITLGLSYGNKAVTAFSAFYRHNPPLPTEPGSQMGVPSLTFIPVRVHGL